MAYTDIRLSVAEERTIYDVADIDRALEDAAGNRNEALAALYEKMKQRGGGRFLIRPSGGHDRRALRQLPELRRGHRRPEETSGLSVAGNEPMSSRPSCCSANRASAKPTSPANWQRAWAPATNSSR
jgi:ATP-dependent Lon protease